jgi:hypothetical protein
VKVVPHNPAPAHPGDHPKFKSLDVIPGLSLPWGEDMQKPKSHIIRRRVFKDPAAILRRIETTSEQGWDEHVTESQDQVVFDLWPHTDLWLFRRLERLILNINAKHFGLDLTYWHVMRLNKYREGRAKGHRMHSDYVGPEPAKLAFSIPLVVPEEGGRMSLAAAGTVELGAGDLLVFPAYEAHEVEPATKGERVSLTGWLGGPALR